MCTATSGPLAKHFGAKTDPVGQPAFVAQRARRSPVTNTGTLLTAPVSTGNGAAATLLGG